MGSSLPQPCTLSGALSRSPLRTHFSFLIFLFSGKNKNPSQDIVFCLLFPFLPWRGWTLKANLENQTKQETREKTRPLGTSLENEDRLGDGVSFSPSNMTSVLSLTASYMQSPPLKHSSLPPILHPFCLEESLIIFHSLCAQTSSFSAGLF